MYTITHFGRTIQATGPIGQALQDHGINVGEQTPYVNGQEVDLNHTPHDGANVSFRPAASRKA